MPEAAASQGGDSQQLLGDAANPLNEDPSIVDLVDREDFHVDPMNLDDLPTGLNADVGVEAENAKDQAMDAEG